MLNYTEDVIEIFNRSSEIEGVSIEEVRDALADKRGLSKIKSIGVIKTISQSKYCKSMGDSEYLISFLLKSEGKKFKFNIDDKEHMYTHLVIEKRQGEQVNYLPLRA